MKTVKTVSAGVLASYLALPLPICDAFLRVAQEREPDAGYHLVHLGQETRVTITFPYDDMLELERYEGFAVIGCGGGGFPGVQHFTIIPRGSITRPAVVDSYQQRFRPTTVVEDAVLLPTLRQNMQPVYDRINSLRAREARHDTGIRRVLRRFRG